MLLMKGKKRRSETSEENVKGRTRKKLLHRIKEREELGNQKNKRLQEKKDETKIEKKVRVKGKEGRAKSGKKQVVEINHINLIYKEEKHPSYLRKEEDPHLKDVCFSQEYHLCVRGTFNDNHPEYHICLAGGSRESHCSIRARKEGKKQELPKYIEDRPSMHFQNPYEEYRVEPVQLTREITVYETNQEKRSHTNVFQMYGSKEEEFSTGRGYTIQEEELKERYYFSGERRVPREYSEEVVLRKKLNTYEDRMYDEKEAANSENDEDGNVSHKWYTKERPPVRYCNSQDKGCYYMDEEIPRAISVNEEENCHKEISWVKNFKGKVSSGGRSCDKKESKEKGWLISGNLNRIGSNFSKEQEENKDARKIKSEQMTEEEPPKRKTERSKTTLFLPLEDKKFERSMRRYISMLLKQEAKKKKLRKIEGIKQSDSDNLNYMNQHLKIVDKGQEKENNESMEEENERIRINLAFPSYKGARGNQDNIAKLGTDKLCELTFETLTPKNSGIISYPEISNEQEVFETPDL